MMRYEPHLERCMDLLMQAPAGPERTAAAVAMMTVAGDYLVATRGEVAAAKVAVIAIEAAIDIQRADAEEGLS